MNDHTRVRAGPPPWRMRRLVAALASLAALSAALGGCASRPAAPEPTAALAPPQWQAPLPHQGSVTDLARWWQQFNDPLLSQLIAAAENVSPTLASAQSRIAQARAARVASGAALLPAVNANANVVRGR